ncbi:MAG: hypothetical protein LBC67_00060 [Spirochaetales bacterium]|jgi:hypothetical protein|nr:hypothetical protein [Spirochaetales bacterium]
MNDALIVPLIVIAAVTTLGYYRGRKKNRWISSWISREAEDALQPEDTNYVNFGGVIGYNFVYKMKKPYREAKGTFTLLPRHSILFMPISLVITRHDRYYLQLYADGKLLGEGHILAKSYYGRALRMITGVESLQRGEAERDGKRYILLWKGKNMEESLKRLLDKIEHPELLLHFCCYSENKNFFLYAKPQRQKLGELLTSCCAGLKPFFLKGGNSDGPEDEGEN